MTKFSQIALAVEAGLPDGWRIVELSQGNSIHYYDSDDPWYLYARSEGHYIEHAFGNKTAIPHIITDQVKIAVENVLSPLISVGVKSED